MREIFYKCDWCKIPMKEPTIVSMPLKFYFLYIIAGKSYDIKAELCEVCLQALLSLKKARGEASHKRGKPTKKEGIKG